MIKTSIKVCYINHASNIFNIIILKLAKHAALLKTEQIDSKLNFLNFNIKLHIFFHVYCSVVYQIYLYINLACLSVCPFVSNKRRNGWTDRAQIFCGTSHDPREGLWMIKFSKICLHQNLIFENFENPRIFFLKICEIFCFCYFE